jgi:hypothetical protein
VNIPKRRPGSRSAAPNLLIAALVNGSPKIEHQAAQDLKVDRQHDCPVPSLAPWTFDVSARWRKALNVATAPRSSAAYRSQE